MRAGAYVRFVYRPQLNNCGGGESCPKAATQKLSHLPTALFRRKKMKTELDENGVLTIIAETPIEAYSLKKWCEDNNLHSNSLIIDYSLDKIKFPLDSK